MIVTIVESYSAVVIENLVDGVAAAAAAAAAAAVAAAAAADVTCYD